MQHQWLQTAGSLALTTAHGRVVWQLNCDPREGKPYFHPLTASDGTVLTALRPADHPWHRGIWWSWKHINGLNYWEEDAHGVSEGRTRLVSVVADPREDFSAVVDLALEYHPPDLPPVLAEQRRLRISAPRPETGWTMDWESRFTAQVAVELDRTPVSGEAGGQRWGGYAGLSVRLADTVSRWQYRDSVGREGADAIRGQRAEWVEYRGPVGTTAGAIRVVDDARNPRHPTAWYVWRDGMHYFSPAILYREPLRLQAGETLTLRYRIEVNPG